jgi:hypothetical protein
MEYSEILNGVFGFIDGAMHHSTRPDNTAEQTKYYNGYYGVCGYKGVYLVGADECILWAKLDDGREYDNSVYLSLENSLYKLCRDTIFKSLGDSAFTPSSFLVRPYKTREITGHPDRADKIRKYNKEVARFESLRSGA